MPLFAKFFKLLTLPLLLSVMAACSGNGTRRSHPTPPEYDLNHPKVIKLGDKLNEISGLAFYQKDSSVFAIVDEVGVLFKIILTDDKPVIQQWHFATHADYEDMVLLDSTFYVLKSDGDIIAAKFTSPDSVNSQKYDIPLKGKNEFEILYYDSSLRKLVLICKDCEADNKSTVSTWAFDPQSRSFDSGPFIIDANLIDRSKTGAEKEKKFKPSAAAINPISGDLYIVSSINKALVIADKSGKVKSVYPLPADLYKQPEGIAFTPSGDMFISNEAAGEGLPNLLYFKYKKAVHEK